MEEAVASAKTEADQTAAAHADRVSQIEAAAAKRLSVTEGVHAGKMAKLQANPKPEPLDPTPDTRHPTPKSLNPKPHPPKANPETPNRKAGDERASGSRFGSRDEQGGGSAWRRDAAGLSLHPSLS